MKTGVKVRLAPILLSILITGVITATIFQYNHISEEKLITQQNSIPKNPSSSDGEDYFGLHRSTYFGGSDYEYGYSIAVDQNTGAYFITGYTSSTNYPRVNAYDSVLSGPYDSFVTKFNADGTINFSTYLGGSSSDYARDIVVDSKGACYVVGYTYSSNFPTFNAYDSVFNGYTDAFITKFNPNGSLNFSTYIGGSSDEDAYGIAIHNDGSFYVTGSTTSSNFPTLNAYDSIISGSRDIYLTKFNPDGSMNFSTYFGGTGYEYGYGIVVDEVQNIYITGETSSSSIATADAADTSISGSYDGLVARFNPNGTLNYSTYFGSTGSDQCNAIAVDNEGAFYVTGEYYALTNYQFQCVKYNPNGSINYTKIIGGSLGVEEGTDLVVDDVGNCYIVGTTTSTNFPTVHAFDETHNSYYSYMDDTFICQLDTSGNIIFSSYLGGSSYDNGMGIALDSNSTIYLTGYTRSVNFPMKNAYDSSINGYRDAFITILDSPVLDSDLDGLPNYWEYEMGMDINNAMDAGYDYDSDFLNNTEEYFYGTHARDEDTDNDGLLDGDEVKIYLTDPLDVDTDNDTMEDGWEILMGLNATYYGDRNGDADLDNLPNYWEYSMQLNATNPLDATWDSDSDNLTNYEEYTRGLNARNPDTDNDGLEDGEEVQIYMTNPKNQDSDYDQAIDGIEVLTYGTDPLNPDTDGDGIYDGYEISCNLQPLNPADANLDKDNDGMPNLWEFQMGLNANNYYDANYDKDYDGMPNLWEYQYGLDASDSNDGNFDLDHDRLINRYEYQKGTDPYNPDTDGDGFLDGNDNNPLRYMQPTGRIIFWSCFVVISIISVVTRKVIKRVKEKKLEFERTYFFCPKCSMQNRRATGVCVYCGEEMDGSKIEQLAIEFDKNPEKMENASYCQYCGSVLKKGICPKCKSYGKT